MADLEYLWPWDYMFFTEPFQVIIDWPTEAGLIYKAKCIVTGVMSSTVDHRLVAN